MRYTGNYNLKKYDDTDAADPVAINDNMDIVDGELAKRASLVGGVVPLPQLPVLPYPVNTSGSGSAYTATIDGITTLTKGLLITIIPHTSSTSISPTLNLNGLGAKTIKRRYSYTNNSTSDGQSSNWLTSAKPQLLQYDGTYWIAVGANKPYGPDMYGTVGVSNGGTGKTSWTSNRLVYASTSSVLNQLAPPTLEIGYLTQGASGAPSWVGQSNMCGAIGAVPEIRKVNGKPLTNDIQLAASDVGAAGLNSSTGTVSTSQLPTIPVNKGGTGKANWTSNRLIYPSSATVFTQIAFPEKSKSILKQDMSGAPYWSPPATNTTHTLYASNWSGTEAPYTYNLSVSGVTTTSNQDLLPSLTVTAEQLETYQSANIQDGGQATGTLILKAWGDKPGADIPVRVVVRGDA